MITRNDNNNAYNLVLLKMPRKISSSL